MASTQGIAQPQQYVVLCTQQPGATPRPAQTVGYSKKNKQTVKGLALTQLILGFVILVCQTVTTVMDDKASNRAAIIDRKHNIDGLLPYGLTDNAGTGIWVGIGTVLTAFIGIVGYRKQKKSPIITHLILNVFLLIAYNVLIGTLSATIASLQQCRSYGHYVHRIFDYSYGYSYYYGSYRTSTTSTTSTTTPAPVLFGEKINLKPSYFHCSHSFFRSWLAIEVILLICCLIAFFITLTLLIYNSIALCMCCRRTGCCGSCCYSYYNPVSQEVPAVVYSTQQPVQQFVQPQAVPQLQAVPQYYPQPAPMPVQHAQQTMVTAAPVVTYPAAVAAQPPAPQPAANNEEGKWEELPPEYRTLAPRSN